MANSWSNVPDTESRPISVLAPCQKQQQLSLDTHENMIDGICLWVWLRPKIEALVSAEYMTKLEDMFFQGTLVGSWDEPTKTRHTSKHDMGSRIVMGFSKIPSQIIGLGQV